VDAAVHSLDYWLAQARSCASLQPVEHSTTLVCNEDTRLGVVAWARLRGISEDIIRTEVRLFFGMELLEWLLSPGVLGLREVKGERRGEARLNLNAWSALYGLDRIRGLDLVE